MKRIERSLRVLGFALGLAELVGGAASGAVSAQTPAPSMAAMDHARAKAAPSAILSITAIGKTATFRVADLQAMQQKTITVHNAHRDADETYTGVSATDLLAKAGAGEAGSGKALLRSYLKAEGSDRYWVLFSGIEVEAASHLGDVLVATALDGKPLGDNGAFMLISTEDRKPQRWVRNLTAISLVAVP